MTNKRVQKLLSNAGHCSRREGEKLIKEGRVTVNGDLVTIGDKASREDTICVDNEQISFDNTRYIAFHKPSQVLSTLDPVTDRECILDFIDIDERVYPCGRLDYDAEGLLILTNDGDFANRVMHPRYEKIKEYKIWTSNDLDIPSSPFTARLEDGPVTVKDMVKDGDAYIIRIGVGKNHVVKRIAQSLGGTVTRLLRTKIGGVTLDVKKGEWRNLAPSEVKPFFN